MPRPKLRTQWGGYIWGGGTVTARLNATRPGTSPPRSWFDDVLEVAGLDAELDAPFAQALLDLIEVELASYGEGVAAIDDAPRAAQKLAFLDPIARSARTVLDGLQAIRRHGGADQGVRWELALASGRRRSQSPGAEHGYGTLQTELQGLLLDVERVRAALEPEESRGAPRGVARDLVVANLCHLFDYFAHVGGAAVGVPNDEEPRALAKRDQRRKQALPGDEPAEDRDFFHRERAEFVATALDAAGIDHPAFAVDTTRGGTTVKVIAKATARLGRQLPAACDRCRHSEPCNWMVRQLERQEDSLRQLRENETRKELLRPVGDGLPELTFDTDY